MAMRFPYRWVPIPNPAHTLGGLRQRPRPIVDLSVTSATTTIVVQVTVDSGADEIVLDERVAIRLGIDLSGAPTGASGGIGSPLFTVRYARVVLRLSDGIEFRSWNALVGFAPVQMTRGLFGFAQGMQYFKSVFFGSPTDFELETNATYPGA